jgi:hypothetical protein
VHPFTCVSREVAVLNLHKIITMVKYLQKNIRKICKKIGSWELDLTSNAMVAAIIGYL